MELNKNIIIAVLVTILLAGILANMRITYYKDMLANNRLESVHPYNHCVQMFLQYSEDTEQKISFDDAQKHCEPLLVDRKEYKQYHNSNKLKTN